MTDYNENRWENYEEGTFITFTENGVILARLTDNKTPGQTGNVGATVTGNVMKIDRLLPNVAPTATRTHNSITVTANATDPAARTEYACSGIDEEEGYRFKLGEGRWTAYQSSGEYTFNSNVSAGTNYTITVEAKDKAGNTKEGTVEIRTLATYTVTYDANGGRGAPSSQIKTEGTNLTLSNVVPRRNGYTFKGWSTSSSATVEYKAGVIYDRDSDLSLYAVWELTKYYFLNKADACESLTGGWTRYSTYGVVPTHDNTGIRIVTGKTHDGYAKCHTANKISMARYKKLYVTYDLYSIGASSYQNCMFYFGLSTRTDNSGLQYVVVHDSRFRPEKSVSWSSAWRPTVEYDVSNITGDYYLYAEVACPEGASNTNDSGAQILQVYATY